MLCNVHCSSSTQALCLCITLQIVVLCLCLHGWKSPNKSASVLWSIKLWLILPVMWKQRVYKMPSHNGAVSLGPKKVNVAVREFVCLHGEDQMDCCLMFWSRFFLVSELNVTEPQTDPREYQHEELIFWEGCFSSSQVFWSSSECFLRRSWTITSLWLDKALQNQDEDTGNYNGRY